MKMLKMMWTVVVVLVLMVMAQQKSFAAIGDVWCAGSAANGWCFNASGSLVPYTNILQNIGSGSYRLLNVYSKNASFTGVVTMAAGSSMSGLANLSLTYGISAATGVFSGALSAATLNTGNGAYELYAMDQNVRTTDTPAFAGASFTGAPQVPSKTISELDAINPGAAGKIAFCSDCSIPGLSVSTGATVGAWVLVSTPSAHIQ